MCAVPLAAKVEVDGAAVTWTVLPDGYTVEHVLSPGAHSVTFEAQPFDLDDKPLTGNLDPLSIPDTSDRHLRGASFPSEIGIEQGMRAPRSEIGNPFGFHGLPVDEETGLIYMRNRYYDPDLGRFITTDPYGYTDGPNLYQFALNDPVNNSDPTGELVWCLAGGVISVAVGMAVDHYFDPEGEYTLADGAIDFAVGSLTCGAGGLLFKAARVGAIPGRTAVGLGLAADAAITAAGESTRSYIDHQELRIGRALTAGIANSAFGYVLPFTYFKYFHPAARVSRRPTAQAASGAAGLRVQTNMRAGSLIGGGGGSEANLALSSEEGVDIVLGVKETLRATSKKTGGVPFYFWKRRGLTSIDVATADEELFSEAFYKAIGKARRIYFNLDRLNLRRAAVEGRRPLNFDAGNATSWELLKILRNPKVTFLQNGRPVSLARVLERLGK